MSEFIQNKQHRQDKLKELIKRLHDGAAVEEVQADFNQLTDGVTATEIAEMEQALVNEGMPVSDIQRLCDVHASVFKGSIEDIHKDEAVQPVFSEGHPVLTLKAENTAIQSLLDKEISPALKKYLKVRSDTARDYLTDAIKKLMAINKHYSRKENLIFPIMEKYDITAPPQVMWGVDDEIRDKIKAVIDRLEGPPPAPFQIKAAVSEMIEQVSEMIFKEEEIMIPMVLEKFSNEDWVQIEASGAEIGFTMILAPKRWNPVAAEEPKASKAPKAPVAAAPKAVEAIPVKAAPVKAAPVKAAPVKAAPVKAAPVKAAPVKAAPVKAALKETVPGIVQADSQTKIKFDAGSLTSEEINAILNTVPLDMTFVGADDKVRYFTQGKERVFDRPLTIIGRQIKLCHPPKSVHIVEKIVADLRSGKKDNEDFWLKMGDAFVYIRYFAVRSKNGEYLGTLEVTQNIKHITELEGEKRLMT